jgi:hypothetical protein
MVQVISEHVDSGAGSDDGDDDDDDGDLLGAFGNTFPRDACASAIAPAFSVAEMRALWYTSGGVMRNPYSGLPDLLIVKVPNH